MFMSINRTVTKQVLEQIIQNIFFKYGSVISSSLLDSLKLLGFTYATYAGISISLHKH